MIGTMKTIAAGARSWWREYRALDREKKHLFIAVAVGTVLAYFIVSTMAWKSGEIEGQQKMIAAMSNIEPVAAAVRDACKPSWDTNKWESDCALFFSLRERRAR